MLKLISQSLFYLLFELIVTLRVCSKKIGDVSKIFQIKYFRNISKQRVKGVLGRWDERNSVVNKEEVLEFETRLIFYNAEF